MPRPPFHDLRSFLAALEAAGELARVSVEVDPVYEITQIVQETQARRNQALLFERVKGSAYPVAVNLLGSPARLAIAFGREPAAIGAEFARLLAAVQPPTPGGLWRARDLLWRARFMRPARARRTAGEIPPDFGVLPALHCWPGDAGRFLTFGLVRSGAATPGRENLGVYRMQLLGGPKVAMHWQIQKGGAAHAAEAGPARIPVAITIGADPASMFAAICPLPEGVDELAFAGWLRGGATRLARGAAVPLTVPAEAEIVAEGFVDPAERVPEGPFGDHFGHYSHQAPFPVFTATRMTARRNAVYVASVVGQPPQEDRAIGDAINGMFTPFVRMIHPELADLWSYQEAGFHNLLVVSVRQRYAKEGVKTALGLLGNGQLSLTKVLVLVDAGVDVRSFPAVLRAVGANFDPAEDLLVLHRTALDTLDFTSGEMNLGSKMIVDATSAPGAPAPVARTAPPPAAMPGVAALRAWEGALLAVQPRGRADHPAPDRGEGREALGHVLASPAAAGFKFVATVSEDVDLANDVSLLWGIFTRFDCARDVLPAKSEIRGAWPKLTGPVGIDATFKSGYPDPVTMLPEVVERVRHRWPEYRIPS